MGMSSDANLFSPFNLGGFGEIKNRIALASLTRGRSDNGVPTDLMAEHYCQRVSAGLLLAEATGISPTSTGFNRTPYIYSAEHVEGWKKVTQKVHENDGKIALQLWHMGRAVHPDFINGELPVSASAERLEDEHYVPDGSKKTGVTPRPLKVEEMPKIVDEYKLAAKNAIKAGFDGVEIHSANGYLLDQFLQSKTNKRTDEYGGSVEKRFRLLGEVIEGVLEECPADRVGIKLSPNGVFNGMGSEDYVETFSYVLEKVAGYELSYVQVMDGLAFGFHELGDPFTLKMVKNCIEKVQGKERKTAIMGNCGYTKETAEKAITEGDADLISFGRPFIGNPDLVERFKSGAELVQERMEDWYTLPSSDPADDAEGYTTYLPMN